MAKIWTVPCNKNKKVRVFDWEKLSEENTGPSTEVLGSASNFKSFLITGNAEETHGYLPLSLAAR